MREFFHILGLHPEALIVFIISCFIFLGFILFVIFNKLGLISYFNLSKEKGITFDSKKEIEKKVESGNINKLMDDQINKLDNEMLDYALERSNNIRRILSKQLNTKIYCSSSRRALAACLRYPLYEASRRNNFKYVLRLENIKFYIDRVMKELAAEYEEFAIEIENTVCPVDNQKSCKQLPPIKDVFEDIKNQLIDQWAIPIRNAQIKTHHKKIDIYRQFTPSFDQLGDTVRVKVCEACIDKNTNYINALNRKPEVNEL
jgi:hypothetical protein